MFKEKYLIFKESPSQYPDWMPKFSFGKKEPDKKAEVHEKYDKEPEAPKKPEKRDALKMMEEIFGEHKDKVIKMIDQAGFRQLEWDYRHSDGYRLEFDREDDIVIFWQKNGKDVELKMLSEYFGKETTLELIPLLTKELLEKRGKPLPVEETAEIEESEEKVSGGDEKETEEETEGLVKEVEEAVKGETDESTKEREDEEGKGEDETAETEETPETEQIEEMPTEEPGAEEPEGGKQKESLQEIVDEEAEKGKATEKVETAEEGAEREERTREFEEKHEQMTQKYDRIREYEKQLPEKQILDSLKAEIDQYIVKDEEGMHRGIQINAQQLLRFQNTMLQLMQSLGSKIVAANYKEMEVIHPTLIRIMDIYVRGIEAGYTKQEMKTMVIEPARELLDSLHAISEETYQYDEQGYAMFSVYMDIVEETMEITTMFYDGLSGGE